MCGFEATLLQHLFSWCCFHGFSLHRDFKKTSREKVNSAGDDDNATSASSSVKSIILEFKIIPPSIKMTPPRWKHVNIVEPIAHTDCKDQAKFNYYDQLLIVTTRQGTIQRHVQHRNLDVHDKITNKAFKEQ